MIHQKPFNVDAEFDKRFYPLDRADVFTDEFANGMFWGRRKTLEEVLPFIHKVIEIRDRERRAELVKAVEEADVGTMTYGAFRRTVLALIKRDNLK